MVLALVLAALGVREQGAALECASVPAACAWAEVASAAPCVERDVRKRVQCCLGSPSTPRPRPHWAPGRRAAAAAGVWEP